VYYTISQIGGKFSTREQRVNEKRVHILSIFKTDMATKYEFAKVGFLFTLCIFIYFVLTHEVGFLRTMLVYASEMKWAKIRKREVLNIGTLLYVNI